MLFYQSSKHLMPVCAVDNFWGELNIATPMFLGHGQRQFSRSQILIMGPVWKISQWNLACLLHKYSETSKPNFRGNIKFLLVLWPLEVYSNSLCRQPAPVCPAMGEIRYNTAGNPWQNEKLLYPPKRSLGGVYWIHPVRPSVCLSVCPSVRGSVSGW